MSAIPVLNVTIEMTRLAGYGNIISKYGIVISVVVCQNIGS